MNLNLMNRREFLEKATLVAALGKELFAMDDKTTGRAMSRRILEAYMLPVRLDSEPLMNICAYHYCPSILLEAGNIHEPEQLKLMKNKEYREQLAGEIILGIRDYANISQEMKNIFLYAGHGKNGSGAIAEDGFQEREFILGLQGRLQVKLAQGRKFKAHGFDYPGNDADPEKKAVWYVDQTKKAGGSGNDSIAIKLHADAYIKGGKTFYIEPHAYFGNMDEGISKRAEFLGACVLYHMVKADRKRRKNLK